MNKILSLFLIGFLLAGNLAAEEEVDPVEGLNRKMFTLNDTLDAYILKPVAKGYKAVMPDAAEKGVSNVFSNIGELKNIANDVLQGKFGQAGNDTGRFLINTTIRCKKSDRFNTFPHCRLVE